MNQDKYRLTQGKHHRQNTNPADPLTPGFTTFRTGDVFVPTDDELRMFRKRLDGPLSPDTPVGGPKEETAATSSAPVTLQERAAHLLKSPVMNLRDEIRKIDGSDAEELLFSMQQQEAQKEAPRKQVLEMIERKRQSFASITT